MQFTTFDFAVFFPFVVICYYLIPARARQVWLLLASYYFYMSWNPTYALLILVSTVITYFCALLLAGGKGKKLILIAGLILNLGLLVFFKYSYFLYDTVSPILQCFGMTLKESRLDIILPVGISFYTFQGLGYTIDVYRGDIKPEKNFIRYALFVSFFPQLVAGPIERSGHLLTQLWEIPSKRLWNFDRVTRGLLMMLWGYFLKMVIADRAAVLVNQVFDLYYMFQGAALFTAMLCFMIQLYCDFAAYSAIAIGAAGILGIELVPNFRAPFLAGSVKEFWRRWHISLSTWLRDYVYIPLGGSRCSGIRKSINLMITFLISGLWHGAAWHYVLWGGLQGIFIIIGDFLRPYKDKLISFCQIKHHTLGYRVLQIMGTLFLILLSLIFFRAPTIKDGFYYLQRMTGNFDIWSFFDGSLYHLGLDAKECHVLLFGILLVLFVDLFYEKTGQFFDSMIKGQCLLIQYLIVTVLFFSIVIFGVYGEGYDAAQFIYFQF